MRIRHLSIIPDGNRRWARSRGLPDVMGHQHAAEKTLPALLKKVRELDIRYFTFWAMSTENFSKRPPEERKHLFFLLEKYLDDKRKEFIENQTRFCTIGRVEDLPESIKLQIDKTKKATAEFDRYFFTLALNYGGRDELVRAVNRFLQKNKYAESIEKDDIAKNLDTSFMPDPDLIIRTGREKRLSGFMLWQSEYSEFFFSDKYFPEFTPEDLEQAVQDFLRRQRRFGR